MSRPMKLRFAPSPTGFLHVGGARTAIFNLLHARRHGGKLLLRIEDTDVERSKQHHAEQIVSSLEWLGVEWDEGPIYQSDRIERYRDRAVELVQSGSAYPCYCSVEELEEERDQAEKAGRAYRYSGKCRVAAESGISLDRQGSSVIRFKVPEGAVEFQDLIRGDVRFEADLIDDFVLLRSDGNPTYHLSVVVDDIDMEITHVARGDDHLSNTPKHILLFRAFDSAVPLFGHLPLILGDDKKRLSKRSGATSVEEYQSLGILPVALFNFLVLLGWAPGGDREIFSKSDAVEMFDLGDVNRSPAVFDVEKLTWLNAQYLNALEPAEIIPPLRPFLTPPIQEGDRLLMLVGLLRPRSRTLRELAEQLCPYFVSDDELEYDLDAVKKHLTGEEVSGRMRRMIDALAGTEPFDAATTEKTLRLLAETEGISAGKLIHPLRVSLVGKSASPGIFEVLEALGRDSAVARIGAMVRRLPQLLSA